MIVETGAAYLELFEIMSAEATDPAAAVKNFFDGAAEALEQGEFVDVCPIGTVAREVANTNDHLRREATRVFTTWINAVAQHLIDAGMNAETTTELAVAVVSGLEGGFVLARTLRDGQLLRDTGDRLSQLIALDLHKAGQRSYSTRG